MGERGGHAQGLTRRRFIGSAAAAGAAAALPRVLMPATALAKAGKALSSAQMRTIEALAAAVAAAPGTAVDAADARRIAERVDAACARNEDFRRSVVAMVDAVDTGPDRGRFAELGVQRRLATLRAWLRPDVAPERASDAQRRWAARAQSLIDVVGTFARSETLGHPVASVIV